MQFSTAGAVGQGSAPASPYQPLTGAALAQQLGLLEGAPGGGPGSASNASASAVASAAAAGAAQQYSVVSLALP